MIACFYAAAAMTGRFSELAPPITPPPQASVFLPPQDPGGEGWDTHSLVGRGGGSRFRRRNRQYGTLYTTVISSLGLKDKTMN